MLRYEGELGTRFVHVPVAVQIIIKTQFLISQREILGSIVQ
jgi:hypothetical protein